MPNDKKLRAKRTSQLSADAKVNAANAAERRRVDQTLQALYAAQIARDTPRPAILGPREKRKPRNPGPRTEVKKRKFYGAGSLSLNSRTQPEFSTLAETAKQLRYESEKSVRRLTDIESALIWGPRPNEVRKTFAAAQPILEKLPVAIDPLYVLYLLRERTWIAEKHSGPEQLKIERSWIVMCRAVEGFLNTISEQPSTELVHPELANALKRYSDKLSLPSYEEALEKKINHRPGVFWSDATALDLANHFKDKTGSSRWRLVAGLMQCAPAITIIDSSTVNEKPVSMEQRQIRQRIVRWQREKKQSVLFKPLLSQIAYGIKLKYSDWVKTGASGPCPSIIHLSSFGYPTFPEDPTD